MSLESAVKALEAPSQPESKSSEGSTPGKQDEGLKSNPSASNEVSKEAPKASSQFAALARKERAIMKARQEMQAKEQAIAEKASRYSKYEDLEKTAKSNPLAALEALGLSYKQITDYILNDNKPTADQEISSVKEQLDAFKAEQAARDLKAAEREKEQAQNIKDRAVTEFKEEIVEHINSKSDAYELICQFDGQEMIYEVIEENFNSTKRVLSIDEAATMVEKYLEDMVKRANTSKKFAGKKEEPKAQAKAEDAFRPGKTLSNELTSTAPSMLPAATEQDRIRRALAKLS